MKFYEWSKITGMVQVFFKENTPTDIIPDFDGVNNLLKKEGIYISLYNKENYRILADIIYIEHEKIFNQD
jgi:hypothetical protein